MNTMTKPVVYGFQRSTYVNIVRLVLTHKQVAFEFNDLEEQMGSPRHTELHPFGRVPILEHDGLRLYETSAIVLYLDGVFPDPPLQPQDRRARALMHQWISGVNSYYYPWIVYHLAHERLVFPALGITADEKVVAAAMPKIERGLEVLEDALAGRASFLTGAELTLADFFLYPSMYALSLTQEGQSLLPLKPAAQGWLARMDDLPTVKTFRAAMPPPAPIEHARAWVNGHRPKY
jgi:glutathione S-transferase